MTKYIIIFAIVATVFAIATLAYVVLSVIKELRRRAVRGTLRDVEVSPAMGGGTVGFLVLGGLVGAAIGALTGYAVAKPHECKPKQKSSKRCCEKRRCKR